MQKELSALFITAFHDKMLVQSKWPHQESREPTPGVWYWIEQNHRYNTLLWNEEDKAWRTDAGPAAIAASKQLSDQYNQKRNDVVQAIDEAILEQLGRPTPNARLNSESAGSIIDRLSILSLKIHYMRRQAYRTDAESEQIAHCSAKLQQLMVQRHDLGACFDELLQDARQGRAYFKVYRQYKVCNDPMLNPYLYQDRFRINTGKEVP